MTILRAKFEDLFELGLGENIEEVCATIGAGHDGDYVYAIEKNIFNYKWEALFEECPKWVFETEGFLEYLGLK